MTCALQFEVPAASRVPCGSSARRPLEPGPSPGKELGSNATALLPQLPGPVMELVLYPARALSCSNSASDNCDKSGPRLMSALYWISPFLKVSRYLSGAIPFNKNINESVRIRRPGGTRRAGIVIRPL